MATLDAAFVGPGPAINAFIKTKGKVLIIAGTASGGAGLVVSSEIASGNFPADLAGKTLSTPSARQHAGHRAALVARRPRG